MNKILLLTIAATIQISFAQNTFPAAGNVGVGTLNPNSKLVLMNNGYGISFNPASAAAGLAFNRNAADGIIYDLSKSAWQFSARDEMFSFEGYNGALHQLFSVLKNGNFGIGTFNPLAKFEVNNGNVLVKNAINIDNSSSIMISQSITDGDLTSFGTSIRTITQSGGNNTYGMQLFTQESYLTGQTEKIRILGNGNVGIGTTNPTSKLTVAGNINAREVKVTVDAGADFVFEKEYNLPTLEWVDKFIKENKHLPEIASAPEMQKDGINLSEMNIKLLRKVEEMTLYIIEQNIKLEKQNNRIIILENKQFNKETLK